MLHRVERGDPRAIHRTRVGSRRLRELLPVLQLDADTTRKLRRRLRKAARRLAEVRELDVLHDILANLRARGGPDEEALKLLAERAEASRQAAAGRLAEKPVGRELNRLRRRLAQIVEQLPGDDGGRTGRRSWRWALDARVAHRAARLNDAIGAAGGVYLPDRLHAVRIAVKKLRYALELSVDAAGARPGVDLRLLKRSQETLGRLHDLQVLVDFVRQVQATLAPSAEAMADGLARVVRSIENGGRREHARHMRERLGLHALAARLSVPSPVARPAARRAG